MLLLAAFFLNRNEMKVIFVKTSYFLIDYIKIACLLKAVYQILIATQWVRTIMMENHEEFEVQLMKALFGDMIIRFGNFKEWRWTILYEISLLGSIFFAHMWSITKSVQKRVYTQHFIDTCSD